MNRIWALGVLVPLLWACETGPTKPAVDASAYLFDLNVIIDPQLAEFDPNVAKGGGSGLVRGAGMGMGGCILGGASVDAASGGNSLLLGTLFGIFISPGCALIGGIVGSGVAETKEDVATRVAKLNEAALTLGYPNAFERLIEERMRAGPIYNIYPQTEEETTVIEEANGNNEKAFANELAEAEPLDKIISLDVEGIDKAAAAVQEIPRDEIFDVPAPTPARHLTRPNASIDIHIAGYGFGGGGVDPKLPLFLKTKVCVTDYSTGAALLSHKMVVMTKPQKLEKWAELGQTGLEENTLSLLDRVASLTQQAMGRQVKLDHKTSCR
jgi:hypothetical protein